MIDSQAGPQAPHSGAPSSEGAEMLRELVLGIDAQLPESSQPPPVPEVATASGYAAAPVVSVEGEGELHVTFELGGSVFAVPAVSLAEVEVYSPPMPIPGVPEWLLGIRSFRGEVLSITDLAGLLGFSKLTPTEHARTLIVFDPGSPKRVLTGLAVDAVITHQWLSPGSGGRRAAESLGGRLGRFVSRIVEVDGRALAMLELEALLRSQDFLQLDPR